MPTEKFPIPLADGHLADARLERPDGAVRGWALFAHSLSCGKNSHAAVRVSRALAALGIGTLRVDFAGTGAEHHATEQSGFASCTDDIVAACAAMAHAGMAPGLLVGHSFGAVAVMAAAPRIPGLRGIATLAAPARVDSIRAAFGPKVEHTARTSGHVRIPGQHRPFVLTRRFYEALDDLDVMELAANLTVPWLLLHSPEDAVVPIEEALALFGARPFSTSLVSLDGADHLLLDAKDAQFAGQMIAGWARHVLGEMPPLDPHLPAQVVAEETGEGLYQVQIATQSGTLIADEPVTVGGSGSGPGPFELLSAALGACTAMTLRMYAHHKGWPLERVRTAVGHEKTTNGARTDLFSRNITITGPLDDIQRARLLEIADKCPVHRTLSAGAMITTVLADPPAPADAIAAHAREMSDLA